MTTLQTETTPSVPRILVVDDTPDNLFLMNGLLEDRYQVVLAPSGSEALKVVMSDQPPAMVLLDIMMPDMDGYEVLRRIRQHPPTANIPVIFLTALAGTQDELLGLDLGAVDYLTKPVDPDKVVARIEAHVVATLRASQIEALSEKLARYLSPEDWQALFHTEAAQAIRFESRPLTVLYADAGESSIWPVCGLAPWSADVDSLAAVHGGTVDSFANGAVGVFFDEASACLDMAIALRQCIGALHLRIGLHTGVCEMATFCSNGEARSTLIGPQARLAAELASRASSGDILLSPETRLAVGPGVPLDAAGRLMPVPRGRPRGVRFGSSRRGPLSLPADLRAAQ
ncbi:MAG: response regulator [Ramlibacter sp.]|nr:response regulator [Ramlibacter sp.]